MLEGTKSNVQENLIMRFFPPPAFLTMPSVGVDISDRSIKFLEFERVKDTYKLGAFGDVSLEKDAVVGGEIKNEEGLIDGLKDIRGKVKPMFVRASLPEQKAYFFTTDVAIGATHDQIIKVLEFELEEHVPLTPSEAIIDYDRLHEHLGIQGKISVGVTVYPRSTVEKYTRALSRAGFFPLSFEIEAHAILRSVIPYGDRGTFMIVDLGETSTGLSIISNGMLSFTSTLDNAGSDLTSIFMEELSIQKSEVVHAKNTLGLNGIGKHPDLLRRVMKVVGKLGEEMQRHRTYWETHSKTENTKNSSIEEVILCGGNANMKGLSEYLERELKIPVRRANVWKNVFSLDDQTPKIPYEVSLSYSTAIGLALRNDN